MLLSVYKEEVLETTLQARIKKQTNKQTRTSGRNAVFEIPLRSVAYHGRSSRAAQI